MPKVLVSLGRAISLTCNGHKYTWPRSAGAVLCCNETGTKLAIITMPKKRVDPSVDLSKAKRLFSRFNHFLSEDIYSGPAPKLQLKAGRATSIIYESDKFGDMERYIHEFERFPIVWVDRKNKPRAVLTTGGSLAVTARGIEG
jgi:hypothetical protein